MESENKFRIKSYLDGKMSSSEKAAFEKDLREDPDLRKSFVAELFRSLQGDTGEDAQTREMLRSVYAEMPPIRAEDDSRSGIIRFFGKGWMAYAVAASLILAVTYFTIFIQKNDVTQSQEMYAYMSTPVSMERASAGDMNIHERASYFYFQEQPLIDSLVPMAAACNGFCVPRYYLAHAYLKTGQFDKAHALFGDLISDIQRINDVPQLQGRELELRFNALVAEAAATGDRTKVQAELMKLIQELKKSDSLYHLAIRFKGALQ
jgi:tellurite resistance protein